MEAKAIGQRIIRRRYELGVSQKQLAERVARWPSSIQRIERGLSMPPPATLRAIADELDTTVADLLGPEDANKAGAA